MWSKIKTFNILYYIFFISYNRISFKKKDTLIFTLSNNNWQVCTTHCGTVSYPNYTCKAFYQVKYNRRYLTIYYFLMAVQPEHSQPVVRSGSQWMASYVSAGPRAATQPTTLFLRQSQLSRRPTSGSRTNSVSSVWRRLGPPELSPADPPRSHRSSSLKETWACTCVRRTRCSVSINTLWGHGGCGGGGGMCCDEKQLAHQWRSSGPRLRLSGLHVEPPPGWDPPRFRSAPRQLAARWERARTPLLRTRESLGNDNAMQTEGDTFRIVLPSREWISALAPSPT